MATELDKKLEVIMNDPVMATQMAINFLSKHFSNEPWCLTTLTPTEKKIANTRTFGRENSEAAHNFIQHAHGQLNGYFQLNPVIDPVKSKPGREHIKEVQ